MVDWANDDFSLQFPEGVVAKLPIIWFVARIKKITSRTIRISSTLIVKSLSTKSCFYFPAFEISRSCRAASDVVTEILYITGLVNQSLVLLSSNNPLLISRESLTHATDQYDLEEEDEEDRWLSQVV